MNYKRLLFSMALAALLFSACKKDHYDLKNVNGAHVEGELLLPLATSNFSVMDIINRLSLEGAISYDAQGNISFKYSYESKNAVDAHDVMHINDAGFDQHFAFENPYPTQLPITIDTSMTFEQSLSFSSDYLRLLSAALTSGTLGVNVESNVFQIQHVKVTCPQIKNSDGSVMSFDFYPGQGNSVDLSGLRFVMEEVNTLSFSYDVDFILEGTTAPELYFDAHLLFTNLAFSEIRGWIDAYTSPCVIDTTLDFFSNSSIFGNMEINGLDLAMFVRSGFEMPARLTIDTALISGPGIEPYSIFSQMPQVIEVNPSTEYVEAFNQTLSGKLDAHEFHIRAVSDYTLNPDGMENLVTVSEDNTLDFKMDATIPFAFKIDDVYYIDTVNYSGSSIDSIDLIKKMTILITLTSDIPFNINSEILMYDSSTESVIGVLLENTPILHSTFDGQLCTSTFSFEVDNEIIEKLSLCDKLIVGYGIGTEGHNVELNAKQTLAFSLKTKLEYDGIIELKDNNE